MARLWRLPVIAAAAWLGLTAGGCSTSYQLGSLFGKDEDKPAHTGAIPQAARNANASAKHPSDTDLALAKAAAAEVLSRGGKDASAPWENPQTGARGTVTPIATAYNQDGAVCRDFLASFVREGSESWLQGEACRAQRGQWEVRKLTPWKRS